MGAKNKKFLDIIRTVAPTIASALGGPLAGTAIGAISNAIFGKPDVPEAELEATIMAASPETLLALKVAENDFELELKKLELDKDRLAYEDIDSARQRHIAVKDPEPRNLAYLSMLVFAVLVAIVITRADVFVDNQFATVIVSTIMGASIGWCDKAFNFFLGSSRGSKDKTQAMTDAMASMSKRP